MPYTTYSNYISIHALREEGDPGLRPLLSLHTYFYPRPPRGGRRQRGLWYTRCAKFLSTPSARRATRHAYRAKNRRCYFYPRPPRGGRRYSRTTVDADVGDFYPRPPRGGRRWWSAWQAEHMDISIHALREEGDEGDNAKVKQWTDFYPRPPRGGRLSGTQAFVRWLNISIHALREEGDSAQVANGWRASKFLSTPSARRATVSPPVQDFRQYISIHALREEGDDLSPGRAFFIPVISIHALREEGDAV